MTSSEKISGHGYDALMVCLAVELYTKAHCGYRSIQAIMGVINKILSLNMSSIPSFVSIKNWVEKSGYHVYTQPQTPDSDYSLIVDESMTTGGEKLLLALSIPSEKAGTGALQFSDVRVVDMQVKKSWTSETIREVFRQIEGKLRRAARYVIGDNAGSIAKAIRGQNYVHIRDLSHTFAMFLERVYKTQADFMSFTQSLTDVKRKEIMRGCSYPLPPKQRSIARFMNLGDSVSWAERILKNFSRLGKEEQKVFGFIREHIPIIGELSALFQRMDVVAQKLKTEGLSKETVKESTKIFAEMQKNHSRIESMRLSTVARITCGRKPINFRTENPYGTSLPRLLNPCSGCTRIANLQTHYTESPNKFYCCLC